MSLYVGFFCAYIGLFCAQLCPGNMAVVGFYLCVCVYVCMCVRERESGVVAEGLS